MNESEDLLDIASKAAEDVSTEEDEPATQEEELPATIPDTRQVQKQEEEEEEKEQERILPQTLLTHEQRKQLEEQEVIRERSSKDLFVSQAIEQFRDVEEPKQQQQQQQIIEMLSEPPIKGRTVCFDLETTGFSRLDSIVEIGAVELIDGIRTGSLFQSYCQPTCKVHPLAFKVHHLSDEFLSTSPPVSFILTSFIDWVGNSPLIAHNAQFDLRMLSQEISKLNLTEESNAYNLKGFCTLRYFRKLFPGKLYSLGDISSELGVSKSFANRSIHGALLDAEILASCYQHIIKLNI